MRRPLTLTLLAVAALAMPSGVASAAQPPYVAVSVATKNGTLIGPIAVRAKEVRVRVSGKRCTVAAGTPLAALVALKSAAKRPPKVGTIRLRDYAACGKRPSSSSRLYLTGIGADRERAPDGWIYEVNGKGGTTSAADPLGPFGRGRLEKHATVNWRWCRISEDPEGDCGDTLAIGKIVARVTRGGDTPVPSPTVMGTEYTVPVQLRTGANGDANGISAPAPVGTVVDLVAPTGAVIVSGTVGAGGVAVMETTTVVPPTARFIARGATGVAPAGKLLAFPAS
ncbi:MAG: hypothetical protein J7513_05005 [Solirubrobacteraceae bacterium]|nr:hypothetical protein [Solirubrobacteraceae bacterium]